jgi:ribonuclease P protein component
MTKKNSQKFHTLKLKSEFDSVFLSSESIKFEDNFFKIIILKNLECINEITKIGIICSRKTSKSAVIRNRMRRITKEAIKNMLINNDDINNTIIILFPKRNIIKLKTQDVMSKISSLLNIKNKHE